MFGAETLLMNRCATEELFNKTVRLINDFKAYFLENKQPVYENPSPGNKAGGISTLEEKSLGCTQKSGKSGVKDVLMYGDRLTTRGLNLFPHPGKGPGSQHSTGGFRLPHGTLHHRTRDAFRHVYPHCQDVDKHRSIGKQTRLD